jgi:ribonuclease E
MNYVLINSKHKEETRIGIVKDENLINLNIESSLNYKTKGNIYLGKISRIEGSLEAAFVNYGREKQGFLPFKEVSEYLKKRAHNPESENLSINDVLQEGQEVIVQIEKEERGNKGAALTTNINIAGMYMIFNPNSDKVSGISRQIAGKDRAELKTTIKQLNVPKNAGIIIRTAGSGKSAKELQWEVDYLNNLWKAIVGATKANSAPTLIYQESNIIVRTIRDYLRDYTDSLILDNKDDFNQAYEFVRMVVPHYLDKVKFFDDSHHSLFEHFGIEKQTKDIFKREVQLSSGATIVFDTTEALTAIDINSARSNKGANIEDTAYNSNLSAAKEIAKQLQLRDIGGLVVIDFIDMADEDHRNAIVNAMKQHTAGDKARIQIGDISSFGLLEMSRQRLMSSVIESVERVCPTCSGRGTAPSVPSFALDVLRKIIKVCNNKKTVKQITVQSSVDVITYLLNEKRSDINCLEDTYKVKVVLLPNSYMQFGDVNFSYKNNVDNSKHKSYTKIKKPQTTLVDNGLLNIPESAIINSTMPTTPKPQAKVGFFAKIKNAFAPKKQVVKKKSYNNNKKRRNYNKRSNKK